MCVRRGFFCSFCFQHSENRADDEVEQRATTQGKKQALLSLRFSFAIHRSLARACVFHYFTKLCHAVFHGHCISRKNTEEEARQYPQKFLHLQSTFFTVSFRTLCIFAAAYLATLKVIGCLKTRVEISFWTIRSPPPVIVCETRTKSGIICCTWKRHLTSISHTKNAILKMKS